MLGYAFMYLIFQGGFGPTGIYRHSLPNSLISLGWKIMLPFCECNFPPGFGGQKALMASLHKEWGCLRTKTGRLAYFP